MTERGQATPLVLVVVAFAAILSVGVVRVGAVAADRAAAQAAADGAALAGAAQGRAAALEVARANAADLVGYESDGDEARVTVRRHGITATARARWAPATIP